MTAPVHSGGLLESVSRGLLAIGDVFRRSWKWLSVVGLVAILVICVGYVMFGTLKVNPIESEYQVKVQLHESGGLLPNQEVTLRGVPIGRVESVNLDKGGVVAIAAINGSVKLPVDSEVRVSGLSPAGEQYLDFRPTTNNGPFLGNNSVVALGKATTPITLAQVLADSDGLLAQLDTQKLSTLRKELGVSAQGPEKLANILDGGTFLITTLDGVLPETVTLLKSSKVTFSTLVDLNSGLDATGQQLGSTFAGLKKMDGGFRTLLERAPQTLHGVDNLFTDNSDTMVQLLGNLATVAQLNYVRVPALNALFPGPEVRGSMLEAPRRSSTTALSGHWPICCTRDPRAITSHPVSPCQTPASTNRRSTPPTAPTPTRRCWCVVHATRRGPRTTTPPAHLPTRIWPRCPTRRLGANGVFPRRMVDRSGPSRSLATHPCLPRRLRHRPVSVILHLPDASLVR